MTTPDKMQRFRSILPAVEPTSFPQFDDYDFETPLTFEEMLADEAKANIDPLSKINRTSNREKEPHCKSAHITTVNAQDLHNTLYRDPEQFATAAMASIPGTTVSQHSAPYSTDKKTDSVEPPLKKRKLAQHRSPEHRYQPAAVGKWLTLPDADQDIPEVWDEASANAFLLSPIHYLGPCDEDVQAVEAQLTTYQERCFKAMSTLPPDPTEDQVKQMQELVTAMGKKRWHIAHVKAIAYMIPGAVIIMFKHGVRYTGDLTYGGNNELDSTPHSCSQHLAYIINALLMSKRVCKTLMEQKDVYKILSAPNTTLDLKDKYDVNNKRRAKNTAATAEHATSASGSK